MIYDAFYKFFEMIFAGATNTVATQWLELFSMSATVFIIFIVFFLPFFAIIYGFIRRR